MPVLLVFGLYHLLTWFDIWSINTRAYWKRVAIASAVSHVLLVTGFFVFSWIDYQQNSRISSSGLNFDAYLFNGFQFWRVLMIFDTAPTVVLVGLFALLDQWGRNLPGLMVITIATIYIIGTLQWYFVGGGVGAVLERFWSGLKTGDEPDEDWF
jgi:hypothetical protein